MRPEIGAARRPPRPEPIPLARFLNSPEGLYGHRDVPPGQIPARMRRAADEADDVVNGNRGGVTQHRGRNAAFTQVNVEPTTGPNELRVYVPIPNGSANLALPRARPAAWYSYTRGHGPSGDPRGITISLTPNAPGLDWLSDGIRVTRPVAGEIWTGVFVDAAADRAYPRSRLDSLEGTAAYTGIARGIHANPTQSSELQAVPAPTPQKCRQSAMARAPARPPGHSAARPSGRSGSSPAPTGQFQNFCRWMCSGRKSIPPVRQGRVAASASLRSPGPSRLRLLSPHFRPPRSPGNGTGRMDCGLLFALKNDIIGRFSQPGFRPRRMRAGTGQTDMGRN